MMNEKQIGANVWVLVVLFSLLAAGGCQRKEIPLSTHVGGQIFHGIMRSDVRCYRCHGDRGEGGQSAPPLVSNGKTIDRDLFVQTVLNGRRRMPSFQSALTEEEILTIVDWLEQVSFLGAGAAGNGQEKKSN